jgi:ribA/ribD-fused uncharacterized protein
VTIAFFRGKYAFLSNFYEAATEFEGVVYPTSEHAFQAAKSLHSGDREAIRNAPTPRQAKRMGKQVKLREDWEEIKYEVMLTCLRSKFSRGDLRTRLLASWKEPLEEGNTWGDTVWGVVNGVGQNLLGKALMQVRDEIIVEEQKKQKEASERR